MVKNLKTLKSSLVWEKYKNNFSEKNTMFGLNNFEEFIGHCIYQNFNTRFGYEDVSTNDKIVQNLKKISEQEPIWSKKVVINKQSSPTLIALMNLMLFSSINADENIEKNVSFLYNDVSQNDYNKFSLNFGQYQEDIDFICKHTRSDKLSTTLPVMALYNSYYNRLDVKEVRDKKRINQITEYTFDFFDRLFDLNSRLNKRHKNQIKSITAEFGCQKSNFSQYAQDHLKNYIYPAQDDFILKTSQAGYSDSAVGFLSARVDLSNSLFISPSNKNIFMEKMEKENLLFIDNSLKTIFNNFKENVSIDILSDFLSSYSKINYYHKEIITTKKEVEFHIINKQNQNTRNDDIDLKPRKKMLL